MHCTSCSKAYNALVIKKTTDQTGGKKMLVKNIKNTEDVGNAIKACSGNVYLHLNDGQEKNLKEDPFLMHMMNNMVIGEKGLDFRFEKKEDLNHFMNKIFHTYQV